MRKRASVFQADEVCLFSITLHSAGLRKLCRRAITQAAVGTFFVVLLSPTSNFSPRIEQVDEPVRAQTLFSQTCMEALHMRVLRGLARLNMPQVDLPGP